MKANHRMNKSRPALPLKFLCPNCGFAFPPESPDPCRCPQCDALCSSREGMYHVEVDLKDGEPPPLPPTPDERRRYRIIFWMVFISTPLALIFLEAMQRVLLDMMPVVLRNPLQTLLRSALPGLAVLAAGSLITGGCLTRLRRPRLAGWDLVLNALAWALLLFFLFLGIIFMGGSVKFFFR